MGEVVKKEFLHREMKERGTGFKGEYGSGKRGLPGYWSWKGEHGERMYLSVRPETKG